MKYKKDSTIWKEFDNTRKCESCRSFLRKYSLIISRWNKILYRLGTTLQKKQLEKE